ncbi:hypothetical protein MMC17_006406 [Xylographa soralifera]|nr:hypothetical protein [Xylographa soralifera]
MASYAPLKERGLEASLFLASLKLPACPVEASMSQSVDTVDTKKDEMVSSDNLGEDGLDRQVIETDANISVSKSRLVLILLGLSFTIFLSGLDQNVVATAMPAITNEFDSFDDVGCLLTVSAFQLFWGRIYKVFQIKTVFLSAIAVFELGSLVAGVAPTSTALIIGRAISGLGCAGVVGGAFIIIAHSVPLRQRPFVNSLLAIMYGGSCAAGPLLGGAFTTRLTWRWCFYINLPLGAFVIVMIGLACRIPHSAEKSHVSLKKKLQEFDWIGTTLFVPSIVSILLALQWGGSTYSWGNGRLIALYVVFVLGMGSFIYSQVRQKEQATVPVRIMKQRSIAFGSVYSFLLSAAFDQLQYFLPIWFQAVKGQSALESGIMSLPLLIAYVVSSILAGALISKFGQYVPFMVLGSILLAVGAGLTTTFDSNTSYPTWIGFQALAGLGCGFGYDQPQIAAQTVVGLEDVATSIRIVTSFTTFGSAVFLSVGDNILKNRLFVNLRSSVPEVDPNVVLTAGATNLKNAFPTQDTQLVLQAYNAAIADIWYVAAALAGLSLLAALSMEWKSIIPETTDQASLKPKPGIEDKLD